MSDRLRFAGNKHTHLYYHFEGLPMLQKSESLSEIEGRLQALQQYLVSYSDCGVPVFSTRLTDMKSTMNKLHDYLLQCIALQMSYQW